MMSLSRLRRSAAWTAPVPAGDFLRLAASGDPEDNDPEHEPSGRSPTAREDLPYRIEIWNQAGSAVEQVIAITANASIGYAAYYAATREYPDRHVTLRHRNNVVARWSGPKH